MSALIPSQIDNIVNAVLPVASNRCSDISRSYSVRVAGGF